MTVESLYITAFVGVAVSFLVVFLILSAGSMAAFFISLLSPTEIQVPQTRNRLRYFRIRREKSIDLRPYEELKFDRDLLDSMRHWTEPTLPTTFHATGSQYLLDELFRPSEKTLEYVKSLYVSNAKAYSITSDLKSGGIYGTRSALSIVKLMRAPERGEIVGYERACEVLGQRQIDDVRKSTNHFIEHFFSSKNRRESNVVNLHLVLWIQYQLGAHRGHLALDTRTEGQILEYLQACYAAPDAAAFSVSPLEPEVALCGVYFAHRIAKNVTFRDKTLDTYLTHQFSQAQRYVRSCWSPVHGGFSSTPRGPVNLKDTLFGVYMGKRSEFSRDVFTDIVDFEETATAYVLSCRHENGGYSFTPKLEPCAYATRIAIQTLHLLKHQQAVKEIDTSRGFLERLQTDSGGYLGFLPKAA